MVKMNATEARVLGALMEKEMTTPEYYPLSLNALVAACNQKSSREPVMALTEREVETALRSLEDLDLVRVDHGSRVERYENRARTVFHLRRDETALLCLLLLRGPQTPGELRGRAERLFAFDEVQQVVSALGRMSAPTDERTEPLVQMLPRQPGSREARYLQLLCGDMEAAAAGAPSGVRSEGTVHRDDTASGERLEQLERAVMLLTERVIHLEQQAGIRAYFDSPSNEEEPK